MAADTNDYDALGREVIAGRGPGAAAATGTVSSAASPTVQRRLAAINFPADTPPGAGGATNPCSSS